MPPRELKEEVRVPQTVTKPRQGFVRWLFILLALTAIGFFGYLALRYFSTRRPAPEIPTTLTQSSLGPSPSRIGFTFDDPAFFKEWKEHIFHDKTTYQIEPLPGNEKALHAVSEGTSSGYFKELDLDLSKRPVLTWEWKAIRFPSNKKNEILADKPDNDFAARVYAIFKGRTPLVSDVIQYVWDDHFPEGAHAESPYSKRVRVLVVESGPMANQDKWVLEKRDIIKDYEMLFGRRPRRNLLAIGLMSDSDNTGTVSEAFYRNLAIEKAEQESKI